MSKRAEDRKFHFTYKVTCSYNGRVFFGLHSTDELDDSFAGKGYSLSHSVRDYGPEVHKLERIQIYSSRVEAKSAYNELKTTELANPRRPEDRKFHFVYKTTRFDGKYYIGVHSTDDLDDGYKGSGTYIGRSLKKHGQERHAIQILQICQSRDAAFDLEGALVTEDTLKDPMCMNKIKGGRQHGGRVYGVTEETLAKMSASMKEAWDSGRMTGMRGKKHDPEVVAQQVAKRIGKKRTEEQKANLSNGLRQHYSDEVNRLAHKERMSKEEVSAKKRASMLARLAAETPEEREARFAKMKECSNRPEVKAKKSASMKAKNLKSKPIL